MKRYIKHLISSYKTWKYWKNSGLDFYRGFIPSETYLKYLPTSNFGGKRVLNIGCGRNVYPAPNVVNTDLVKGPGVDLAIDLGKCAKKPLPFKDGEFDFIIANHILEHVPDWWSCFQELARVLKTGGKLEVWIPPISSDSAFTYRDHINRIGIESFTGIDGFRRQGTNLWAGEEFKKMKDVAQLHLTQKTARPALKWWCFFAPNSVLEWMSLHLRNVISEEGYFFTKVEKPV